MNMLQPLQCCWFWNDELECIDHTCVIRSASHFYPNVIICAMRVTPMQSLSFALHHSSMVHGPQVLHRRPHLHSRPPPTPCIACPMQNHHCSTNRRVANC